MFCHLANSGTYSFNYRVTNSSSGIFKYKNLWTGPIIHDMSNNTLIKKKLFHRMKKKKKTHKSMVIF